MTTQSFLQNSKKLLILAAVPFLAAGCTALSAFGLAGNAGTFGVAKTVDGGATWLPSSHVSATASLSGLAIVAMAMAPSDTQTIYAGGTSGLWVSHDSAATWKQILTRVAVSDIYLDPSNPARIVIAGIYSTHGKIIQSTDSGASWSEEYNDASVGHSVTGITASQTNTQQLFATLNSGAVITSTDGGKTWAVAHQFSQDTALAVRAGTNNEMYVLLQRKGLQGSVDGGKTWASLVSQLVGNTFDFTTTKIVERPVGTFYRFELDGTQPTTIYLTTGNGLYKSTDNGAHWTYVNLPVSTQYSYTTAGPVA